MQTNITDVCGECSQSIDHIGFSPVTTCAFLVYTSQAPGCSARALLKQALHLVHFPGLSLSISQVLCKDADLDGHVFCALPRSKQLR